MDLKTKKVIIDLGARKVTLKVVSNMDELMDRVTEAEDIPFWAELWPSALALARWLAGGEVLEGLRVLELGAGLGLAGLAAALCGARVVQTDYVARALALAKENAEINGATDIEQVTADWRDFRITRQFDLILGSDIIYEPNLHPHLTGIFGRNLRPGGQVILADPGRQYGRQFIGDLSRQGWLIETAEQVVAYDEKNYAIDIYRLSPPQAGIKGPDS